MKKQIVLVGFMGCGKSSVGRCLASRIRYEYCDVDTVIEEQEGCSITEIFQQKGEAHFRELETKYFTHILETEERCVIATGGGLPMTLANREQLEKHPMVIYLKANVDSIYERVRRNTKRPLLQTSDPRGKITELLAKREATYEAVARITIATDGKSIERVWREIREALL